MILLIYKWNFNILILKFFDFNKINLYKLIYKLKFNIYKFFLLYTNLLKRKFWIYITIILCYIIKIIYKEKK